MKENDGLFMPGFLFHDEPYRQGLSLTAKAVYACLLDFLEAAGEADGDGSRKTGKLFYMGVLLMEKKNALLVTAEEAAKFSDFTFLDAIYMCFDVRKEMIKRMNKSLPCDGLIFNAIFTAGVIQGKREERQRRKRAATKRP